MYYNRPKLLIDGSVRDIFRETLELIKRHILPLSLIWGIFYIPTNVFILLRSGDMMRHLGSGSSMVIPAMLLLSLLGTIPNIVIVLMTARGECEDYNILVVDAFRKLPFYISTTLIMIFRMLPIVILGIVLASLVSLGMDSLTMPPVLQMVVITVLVVTAIFFAFIRYYSAVPFYLVKGVRNLQATISSSILFTCNRRKILTAYGVCSFAPMIVNIFILYFVENEIIYISLGFLLGYYMFISSALYAGLFNHIMEETKPDDGGETLSSDTIGDQPSLPE